MQGQQYTPPNHLIQLDDQIQCFQLSSYEWSQSLVCIAVPNKIILGIVKFPEETENELFEWHLLKELNHDSRCHAIDFAAETSLAVLPKIVKFCAAGSDYSLRIYRTNLQDRDTVQILKGHTSYINDLAFDPEGKHLATVSDDQSCIVWSNIDEDDKLEEKNRSIFFMTSAGVSVKWHRDDNDKLLIAEKRGLIHMYNILSQQIILSIESPKAPLMNVDWATNNRFHLVGIAGGDVFLWNIRNPCRPIETKSIHEDGGSIVKFSPNNESIIASIGRPDLTLKVCHFKSQICEMEASLKLFGGLCWHYRLPYVAAGQDRKLCFWRVHTK